MTDSKSARTYSLEALNQMYKERERDDPVEERRTDTAMVFVRNGYLCLIERLLTETPHVDRFRVSAMVKHNLLAAYQTEWLSTDFPAITWDVLHQAFAKKNQLCLRLLKDRALPNAPPMFVIGTLSAVHPIEFPREFHTCAQVRECVREQFLRHLNSSKRPFADVLLQRDMIQVQFDKALYLRMHWNICLTVDQAIKIRKLANCVSQLSQHVQKLEKRLEQPSEDTKTNNPPSSSADEPPPSTPEQADTTNHPDPILQPLQEEKFLQQIEALFEQLRTDPEADAVMINLSSHAPPVAELIRKTASEDSKKEPDLQEPTTEQPDCIPPDTTSSQEQPSNEDVLDDPEPTTPVPASDGVFL